MERLRRKAVACVLLLTTFFGQEAMVALGTVEAEANFETPSASQKGTISEPQQHSPTSSEPFRVLHPPEEDGVFHKKRRRHVRRRVRSSSAATEASSFDPNLHIVPRQPLYPLIETRTEPNKQKFFVRPLIARYEKPNSIENNFLYPFGQDFQKPNRRYGYCFFTLCRYDTKIEEQKMYREGYFFPFYFYKRGYGEDDYTAVWPLGGTIKNMFGRQRIDWCGWPLYVKTHKNGDTNQWFPFPILNKRGGATRGFAFYPLGGHFYNDKKDLQYFLWPLGYDHRFYDKQHIKKGFLPFYAYEKSPRVKDLSIVWPFFGRRWEQDPNYEEHRILWPLWVQGRGEQRMVNRWAPFYTHSERTKGHYQKTWRLWPLLKEQSWIERDIDVQQQQVLYFLVWNQTQYAHHTGRFLGKKSHFWPFFSSWNNGNGRKQLQILSPLSVFFPENPLVRDIYNPLFHLFRYEKDGDVVRYSFLFNLFQEYRRLDTHELDLNWFLLFRFTKTPKGKSFSLLKGLFEYRKIEGRVSLRLFWLPSRSPKQRKAHGR